MAENAEQDIPQTELVKQDKAPTSRFPKSHITRRGAIKAGLAGLGVLALGRGEVPKAVLEGAEYVSDAEPVRFIFGNHQIPPESDHTVNAFQETGDLRLCLWDTTSTGIMDRSMREAKKQGRPYFMMVDSASASVTQNLVIGGAGEDQNSASFRAEEFSAVPPDWLFLPHPDLSKQGQYPEDIYLIEGDLRRDFGVGDVPNSENYYAYLQGLQQVLQDRYYQKSEKQLVAEVENEVISALPEKLTEGAIGAALLAASLPSTEVNRRRVLRMAALLTGVAAAEIGKGLMQGNAMSLLIGKQSDLTDQKILTALSDSVSWKYADKPTILWVNARTALAVEKAKEIAEHPDPSVSTLPVQIDLLYGSAHSAEVTRIMEDQSYRHQQIAAFLSDILLQIDEYIEGYKGIKGYAASQIEESDAQGHKTTISLPPQPSPYAELRSIRNDLFRAAANSLLSYKISEIHMPWGKETISEEERNGIYGNTTPFEHGLSTEKVTAEVQSLKPVVTDVLRGFGIEK